MARTDIHSHTEAARSRSPRRRELVEDSRPYMFLLSSKRLKINELNAPHRRGNGAIKYSRGRPERVAISPSAASPKRAGERRPPLASQRQGEAGRRRGPRRWGGRVSALGVPDETPDFLRQCKLPKPKRCKALRRTLCRNCGKTARWVAGRGARGLLSSIHHREGQAGSARGSEVRARKRRAGAWCPWAGGLVRGPGSCPRPSRGLG